MDSSEDLEIYKILNKTAYGQGILKLYEAKQHLDKKNRSLLSRLIIQEERDIAFRNVLEELNGQLESFIIKRERFEQLSRGIISLFPRENINTYYIPYKRLGNRSVNPQGSL
ncbi:uncharacterized protein [Prorops nasuta]|uniref:uncharacterized protein isoform X2 n=1 Tax=Prorops nasuta TaxID=863751 RepID=UPI0034CEC59C